MSVMNRLKIGWFLGLASLTSVAVSAQEKLNICLDVDSAPYSYKKKNQAKGFDLDLAKQIANKMGRELNVVWFEGENEKESSDALDANALLSKGWCDLVGGYALFEGSLGQATIKKSRLPDIDGQKRSKEWIKLGVLIPSTPYVNSPFTILVTKKSKINLNIKKLSELKGHKLAGLHGTLPHLLLMNHDKGTLADDMNNLRWVDDIYGRLEGGSFDAILTELHKYEHYEFVNHPSGISKTKYYHPLSFNIGFVALKEQSSLLQEVNFHISNMIKSGDITDIAINNHLTFVQPLKPDVLKRSRLMAMISPG